MAGLLNDSVPAKDSKDPIGYGLTLKLAGDTLFQAELSFCFFDTESFQRYSKLILERMMAVDGKHYVGDSMWAVVTSPKDISFMRYSAVKYPIWAGGCIFVRRNGYNYIRGVDREAAETELSHALWTDKIQNGMSDFRIRELLQTYLENYVAVNGYREMKWGITKDSVEALYPHLDLQKTSSSNFNYSDIIGDDSVSVTLIFLDGKLYSVRLLFLDSFVWGQQLSNFFEKISDNLTDKYGLPSHRKKNDSTTCELNYSLVVSADELVNQVSWNFLATRICLSTKKKDTDPIGFVVLEYYNPDMMQEESDRFQKETMKKY
jgi:hypothetical protein